MKSPQSVKTTRELLQQVFHQSEFGFSRLGFPALLSLCASGFDGASVLLLVPLLEGSLKMDFGFLAHSRGFLLWNRVSPWPLPTGNSMFVLLLASVAFTTFLRICCSYSSSLLAVRRIWDMQDRLRKLLFSRCVRFGKPFFDQTNSGHIQDVLIGAPNMIGNQLIVIHETLTACFMVAVYLPLMFWVSWKLSIGAVLVVPVLYYAMRPLNALIENASKRRAEARESLVKHTANILTGILLVKSYAAEEAEIRRFDAAARKVTDFEVLQYAITGLVRPIQETIFLVALLVLLFALPYGANGHKVGFAPSMLAYVYLLRRVSFALPVLGNFSASLASIHGPLREVCKFLHDGDKSLVPGGKARFDGLRNEIEFKHLSHSFSNGAKVLDEVCFRVAKGKMTAIVGPSGSGKSTLLNLLLRFYDLAPGCILLDGHDIREFATGSLMAKMALIGQDTLLFNDTIRRNLSFSLKEEVPEEELADALGKAELLDWVRKQPHGLDTMIGDRGIRLSGGEKQRLSIARAVLKGADVLLLDEATSSLDSRTEILIEKSIRNLVQGKTSIVVAHRLSTIRNADNIIVLEGGRLVEQGTRQELLELKGRFQSSWNAQKFD